MRASCQQVQRDSGLGGEQGEIKVCKGGVADHKALSGFIWCEGYDVDSFLDSVLGV